MRPNWGWNKTALHTAGNRDMPSGIKECCLNIPPMDALCLTQVPEPRPHFPRSSFVTTRPETSCPLVPSLNILYLVYIFCYLNAILVISVCAGQPAIIRPIRGPSVIALSEWIQCDALPEAALWRQPHPHLCWTQHGRHQPPQHTLHVLWEGKL